MFHMLQRLLHRGGTPPQESNDQVSVPRSQWRRPNLLPDQRQFLVIGLGRFGTSLAEGLIALNHTVLAVDSDYQRVQALSGEFTHILQLDATKIDALREIGADQFDTAIVCIGTDFESNLLATVQLRKLGVRRLITKARTKTQREILLQVGADEVILPEFDAGIRLSRRLSAVNFVDYLELDPDVGVIEMLALSSMHNKTLAELDLRHRHGLTVLAIWRNDQLLLHPDASTQIKPNDKLLVFGRVADARRWKG
jgi:trk system potassium uptake protein TrkA